MRRSLTPAQRRAMWEKQGGKCAQCGAAIDGTGKTCIAEHWATVANGNDQKPDCLLCLDCAHVKTYGRPHTTYGSDVHENAKAKRLAAGDKKRRGPAIPSRPFQQRPADKPYQWPKRKFGQ